MSPEDYRNDRDNRAEVRTTAASYAIGALRFLLTCDDSDAEKLARIGEHVERLDTAIRLSFAADFDYQNATNVAMGREGR
jgi:hypothetical protein